MSTTGFVACTARTAPTIVAHAASSAAVTGSLLPLEGADDTAQGAPDDPHEGDRDGQQRDDVRLEGQVIALAHIGAQRNGPPATAAPAVAGLVGSATESRPGHGDGNETDAVDVLLLTVGGVDA